jgi:DNA-binding MarR family transcriptional regulator
MAESGEAAERRRLLHEILGADKELYWAVQRGNFDQWLRIDVTMPQMKALILVYGSDSNSLRMGQLASALGVALSTATGIVDRLVEQGLLERQEDPDDRRSVVVRLSALGYETMERPHRETHARLVGVLSYLGTEDLLTVARALSIVREATNQAASAPSRVLEQTGG